MQITIEGADVGCRCGGVEEDDEGREERMDGEAEGEGEGDEMAVDGEMDSRDMYSV